MEQFFKKMGWTSIITSLGFSILGLIIAYNPNTTFQIISYILGGILIAYGIIKMVEYLKLNGQNSFYGSELSYGVIAVLLGIVVIVCSDMIETLLRILVGIWIVYSGIMRLGVSIRLQRFNSDNKIWVAVLLIALAMLLCGIYIVASPGAVMMTIGIIMIFYGIMDIIEEIIFMKNVKEITK